jgi:Rieske Fe-S protein
VLAASGIVASSVLVTACGSGDGTASGQGSDPSEESVAGGGASGGDGPAGDVVASVADVPVGGGLVVATRQVVLTQPVEGEVKAFSAVCPHQGCLVTEVRDGEIICPCHGSRFAVDTGDVVSGPAGRGLEERQVTVTDDGITVS